VKEKFEIADAVVKGVAYSVAVKLIVIPAEKTRLSPSAAKLMEDRVAGTVGTRFGTPFVGAVEKAIPNAPPEARDSVGLVAHRRVLNVSENSVAEGEMVLVAVRVVVPVPVCVTVGVPVCEAVPVPVPVWVPVAVTVGVGPTDTVVVVCRSARPTARPTATMAPIARKHRAMTATRALCVSPP